MANDNNTYSEEEKALRGAIQTRMDIASTRFSEGEKLSTIIRDIAMDISEFQAQSALLKPDAEFELPLLDSKMESTGHALIRFSCRPNGTLDVYLIDEEKSGIPVIYGHIQPDKRGHRIFTEAPMRLSDIEPLSKTVDKDYYAFGTRSVSDYQKALLDGINKFIVPDINPDSMVQTTLARSEDGKEVDFANITLPGGIICPIITIGMELKQNTDVTKEELSAFEDEYNAIHLNGDMRIKDAERHIERYKRILEKETDTEKRRELEKLIASNEAYRNNIPNLICNELMQLCEKDEYAGIFTREFAIYEGDNEKPTGSIKVKINPYITVEGNRQKIASQLKESYIARDRTLVTIMTRGNSLESRGGDQLVFGPSFNTKEVLDNYIKKNKDKPVIISDGAKDIAVKISYDEKKDQYIFKNGLKKIDHPPHLVAAQISSVKTIQIYQSKGRTDRSPFSLKDFGKKLKEATVGKLVKAIEDIKGDAEMKHMLQPEVRESRMKLAEAIYKGTSMIEDSISRLITEQKNLNRAEAAAIADQAFKQQFGTSYHETSHELTIAHNKLVEEINNIKNAPAPEILARRVDLERQLSILDEKRTRMDDFYAEQYISQAKRLSVDISYSAGERSTMSSDELRLMQHKDFVERSSRISLFLSSKQGKEMLAEVYNSLKEAARAQKVYVPLIIKENDEKGTKHEIYFSKDPRKAPVVISYEQTGTDRNGFPVYKKIDEPHTLFVEEFAGIAAHGLMETSIVAEEKSVNMYVQNQERHTVEELSQRITGSNTKDGRSIEKIIDDAGSKARKMPLAETTSKNKER